MRFSLSKPAISQARNRLLCHDDCISTMKCLPLSLSHLRSRRTALFAAVKPGTSVLVKDRLRTRRPSGRTELRKPMMMSLLASSPNTALKPESERMSTYL